MSVTGGVELGPAGDGGELPPAELELVALVDRLRPVLGEVIKVAVDAAVDAVPTPTFRPGQVTNINAATGIATVLVDGDTSPISAQVICDRPGVGDRVVVQFVPPATALVVGIVGGGGVPAGTVAFFAGLVTVDGLGQDGAGYAPPRGWLRCRGGLYLAEQHPALYAAIGTTYNTGGESTNPVQFRVPNIADEFILASGSTYSTLGGSGGSSSITTTHLPSHSHDLNSHTHGAGSLGTSSAGSHTHPNGWGTTYVVAAGGAYPAAGSDTAVYTGSAGAHTHPITGSTAAASGSTGSTGSGATFLPPYITLHALIKA